MNIIIFGAFLIIAVVAIGVLLATILLDRKD